ncbi:hypothetical protein [Deinococcus enclensis]|uniref:Uncharacterized protein n=1 Tax=Deinococcus enclensis TaxID=1049582 RepID=A0ABT9MEV5_9DEIO|nr:hypothetical protein [Deinococcus enclensis]MDP9765092.1 hypothetical protein [Deinococcus enclensis]
MDDLALALAREARRLNLTALDLDTADPDALHALACMVLTELAVRGLLPGKEEVGCHAAPRSSAH